MPPTIIIYGKDTCPYTTKAREEYAGKKAVFTYKDVTKSDRDLQEMLTWSQGQKKVPVIVDNGRVTIGYGGGS